MLCLTLLETLQCKTEEGEREACWNYFPKPTKMQTFSPLKKYPALCCLHFVCFLLRTYAVLKKKRERVTINQEGRAMCISNSPSSFCTSLASTPNRPQLHFLLQVSFHPASPLWGCSPATHSWRRWLPLTPLQCRSSDRETPGTAGAGRFQKNALAGR